jgi:hypothetical protein
VAIAQVTTRRLNTSRKIVKYKNPLQGRDVGDVRDVELVRRGGEIPLHQISLTPATLIAQRLERPLATAKTLNPDHAHQPGDTLAPNAPVLILEILVKPWRAVDAMRESVQDLDPIDECRIGRLPLRRPAVTPRIVAAEGYTQYPARGGDAVKGPVHFDAPEDLDGTDSVSRTNQAAAFDRTPFFAQLFALLAQPAKLLLLGRCWAIVPHPGTPVGLRYPVHNGLRRGLKLLGQLPRRAAVAHQLDHLLAALRRVRWSASWHFDLPFSLDGQMSTKAGQVQKVLYQSDVETNTKRMAVVGSVVAISVGS